MVDYSKFDVIKDEEDDEASLRQRKKNRPASSKEEAKKKVNHMLSVFAVDTQLQENLRHPAVIKACT